MGVMKGRCIIPWECLLETKQDPELVLPLHPNPTVHLKTNPQSAVGILCMIQKLESRITAFALRGLNCYNRNSSQENCA